MNRFVFVQRLYLYFVSLNFSSMVLKIGQKEICVISTIPELLEMMQIINHEKPRQIALNLEGQKPSREGRVVLLSLSWNKRVTYVVDVQVSFVDLERQDLRR